MNDFNFVPEFIVQEFHYEILDGKEVRVIDKMKSVSLSIVPRKTHDREESDKSQREDC